jgi:hypothetical protein
MPRHIAQGIGAWSLPHQLKCDHGFGGGNIGVGNSDHVNMIKCGNAILAHTARSNFQPTFQACLLKIRFEKFVLPKSRVRKRSGRRQNDTKNIENYAHVFLPLQVEFYSKLAFINPPPPQVAQKRDQN